MSGTTLNIDVGVEVKYIYQIKSVTTLYKTNPIYPITCLDTCRLECVSKHFKLSPTQEIDVS